MQLTFNFTDDIAQQLQALPNSTEFVNQAIKKALLNKAATEAKPSKWAKFVQEIENSPELQLGDYAEQLKTDLCEFRENFVFPGDEA
ncbi:MAG: hypothetical protein PHY54_11055 [Methylococcales bacterium]|nr:hypothetical protein [Methylococcales bacterium]